MFETPADTMGRIVATANGLFANVPLAARTLALSNQGLLQFEIDHSRLSELVGVAADEVFFVPGPDFCSFAARDGTPLRRIAQPEPLRAIGLSPDGFVLCRNSDTAGHELVPNPRVLVRVACSCRFCNWSLGLFFEDAAIHARWCMGLPDLGEKP
jgi:hypothetical protein